MQVLTPDGQQLVNSMAARHAVSTDAVYHLLLAIAAGGGRQAQFNHPELGGMGQWSQGGMIMVGDMFNQGLKYRVDALCNDLSGALATFSPFAPPPMQTQGQSGNGMGTSLFVSGGYGSRWPAELGAPSSTGSQNDLHYAVFPGTRRLAIDQGGQVTVYDTGDHQIGGVSQQQSGDQSLTFTSQYGLVRLHDLPQVSGTGQAAPPPYPMQNDFQAAPPQPFMPEQPASQPAPFAPQPPVAADASPAPGLADEEIFTRLERLAELSRKGVITEEEFSAKKTELLSRL